MRISDFVELLTKAEVEVAPGESLVPVLTALAAKQLEIAAEIAHASTERHRVEQSDQLLTASEASQRLGVTKDWLYKRASRLPFTVRLGRNLRFSAAGIDKFIRRHRQG